MNLHTLLAATDLSASSRYTAQRAAILAQQIGAKLEFVHVLDKNELNELLRLLGDKGKLWQERIRSQAQESLSQLADDTGKPLGINIGHHLVEGRVLESIATQVSALNVNLLIVGAQGTGFMRQQFF